MVVLVVVLLLVMASEEGGTLWMIRYWSSVGTLARVAVTLERLMLLLQPSFAVQRQQHPTNINARQSQHLSAHHNQ